MSINFVVISGNLTRDPELREATNKLPVLRLGIASNEYRKNGEGYDTYTNYFDAVVFGKRAKALNDLLKKGAKVCVSGKLHYSSWEDDTDKRRSKVEIIASEVELMSTKTKAAPVEDSPTYDDIPF